MSRMNPSARLACIGHAIAGTPPVERMAQPSKFMFTPKKGYSGRVRCAEPVRLRRKRHGH